MIDARRFTNSSSQDKLRYTNVRLNHDIQINKTFKCVYTRDAGIKI